MAGVTCLQFSMQEKDIIRHNIDKCHVCTLVVNLLSIV